jgi:tetrahydromethanopterin S-methyltransferase subunit F
MLNYAVDPIAAEVEKINTRYKVHWICFAAGIPLTLLCVGIGGLIAGVVFLCLLLHQMWGLVQPSQKCSSPGQAVGFLFIPVFNFYWGFVAVWGLAQELNRVRAQRGIPGRPVNEQLAMTACILFCCAIVPYLGILAALAGLIIEIIVMNDMKDAAIDIMRANANSMPPIAASPL